MGEWLGLWAFSEADAQHLLGFKEWGLYDGQWSTGLEHGCGQPLPQDDSCMAPLQVTAETSSASCPCTLELPRSQALTETDSSGWLKSGKGRLNSVGPGSCHLQVTTGSIYK